MSGLPSYWLRSDGGVARRITPSGLLVGRSTSCDIVSRSSHASRRQALIYLAADGPRLAPMGSGEMSVDEAPVTAPVSLAEGARVSIADLSFRVHIGDADEGLATRPIWILEGPGGALFPVGESPFVLGGAVGDGLRVEGWPDGAVELEIEDAGLFATARASVRHGDAELEPGTRTMLSVGDELGFRSIAVRVATGGDFASGSTLTHPVARGAVSARLEFLPRGGRLHVSTDLADGSVYLPDRRCDFVAVLLQPPSPLEPGDFVPDEHVWTRVWGKRPDGARTLNVVLHRLRRDLDHAGHEGERLVERFDGGGATRFVLEPGARIVVE